MCIFQTRGLGGSYFGDHLTFNICSLIKMFQNTNPDPLIKLSTLYFQDNSFFKRKRISFHVDYKKYNTESQKAWIPKMIATRLDHMILKSCDLLRNMISESRFERIGMSAITFIHSTIILLSFVCKVVNQIGMRLLFL